MRVIAKRALREFWKIHQDVEVALKVWFKQVEKSDWKNLNELKLQFSKTDYVGNDRYVFNIKGNHYRLLAKIDFEFQVVYIRFIGTHKAYDKIKNIKTV